MYDLTVLIQAILSVLTGVFLHIQEFLASLF